MWAPSVIFLQEFSKMKTAHSQQSKYHQGLIFWEKTCCNKGQKKKVRARYHELRFWQEIVFGRSLRLSLPFLPSSYLSWLFLSLLQTASNKTMIQITNGLFLFIDCKDIQECPTLLILPHPLIIMSSLSVQVHVSHLQHIQRGLCHTQHMPLPNKILDLYWMFIFTFCQVFPNMPCATWFVLLTIFFVLRESSAKSGCH